MHFGDVKACRTPLKEVKVVAETSVNITLQLNIGLQNSGRPHWWTDQIPCENDSTC